MSAATAGATVVGAGILLRQLVILSAVLRSARYLGQPTVPADPGTAGSAPQFVIVVPVLRETTILAETVAHLQRLIAGRQAWIVVVTTAREAIEAASASGGSQPGTVVMAEQFAATATVIHVHSDDPAGVKGDQLNAAARHIAALLDAPAENVFLVCYDADSRPPLDSLGRFTDAITSHPEASVFHQSARFERRPTRSSCPWPVWAMIGHGLGEGAALRANRFVLGFEIPRLRNRSAAHPVKRRLCSYVYAHVTGHGLCLRLSLLLEHPFPSHSPLEDMHYSFVLGSWNLPMIAVPSLDHAEVPPTVAGQVTQASRWFFGPARFHRYLRDPATQTGWRARLLAASALGSAIEWLGCAIVPPATILLLIAPGATRWLAGTLLITYITQLLITEAAMGAPALGRRRMARVLLCPAATVLFGVGGILGAVHLLTGGTGAGKTERL
jgi:cellulose synthase/poly-beta-1,6-N-acetylglucosamine synthase-like glycosyltransferase